MNFKELSQKAIKIRNAYSILEKKKYGREWTKEQIAEGLVGDIGDLMKLVLAKNGVRNIEDADKKLAHELSDCLWSIIILAHKYEIDLEKSFLETMTALEEKIKLDLN